LLSDINSEWKVYHEDDPCAVHEGSWQEWNIALSEFSNNGIDLNNVRQVSIGVGRSGATLDGTGKIHIDDIRLYKPRFIADRIQPWPENIIFDDIVDFQDVEAFLDNWLLQEYDVTPQDPGTTGLQAYYALQNSTLDGVGGHHGDPCREPVYVPGPTGYGNAMLFDGEGQYVDLGMWNPSEATGQLSVALWAKWGGLSGQYQGLIGKRDTWAASDMMWQIEANVDSGTLTFMRSGSDPYDGDPVLPVDEWAHVAATFDGNDATLYVDGQQTGTGPFSFGSDTASALVFGCCEANGGNPFNGALDEIYLFDRALYQGEVGWLAGERAVYTQSVDLLAAPPNLDLNPDGTIDFKDYVFMAARWLQEQLWP